MRRVLLLGILTAVLTRAQGNVASMQFMITQKMREQLFSLGYSARDISALEPERAAAIIQRSIQRPSHGMPSSWARSEKTRSTPFMRRFTYAVKRAATIGIATALALHFGGLDMGAFSSTVDDIWRTLQDTVKARR